MDKIHWFNFVFCAICIGAAVGGGYVVYVAHSRPSGSSGIDAGKLTQMRLELR